MSVTPIDRKARYEAAIATHAHFDNLCVAIVSAMIAVTGAAFAVKPTFVYGVSIVLLISSVVVLILLRLYEKCAWSALVARNLSSELEQRDFPYGIGYVSINIDKPEFEALRPVRGRGLGRGVRTVTFLAILLASVLFVGSVVELSTVSP